MKTYELLESDKDYLIERLKAAMPNVDIKIGEVRIYDQEEEELLKEED